MLLFNGITKKFIHLETNIQEELKKILKNPNSYENPDYRQLLANLESGGFIIKDSTDEFSIIETLTNNAINKKRLSVTVYPTFKCNFSCWYCIQDHREEFMSQEVTNRLIKMIERYLTTNNIEELEICWFGGEPLLCFESHMRPVINTVRVIAQKHNVKFFNTITTNGALFTKDMILEMNNFNMRLFQITLDGDRENHNKTRNIPDKSSFDIILGNIVALLDNLKNANICLRFNYTNVNILSIEKMVSQMNACIPYSYRSKFKIFPRKIWQVNEEAISLQDVQRMFKLIKENGYNLFEYDMPLDNLVCEAERIHKYTIYHNGKADKCENVQPEYAAYHLSEDRELIRDKPGLLCDKVRFIKHKECIHCKHLPICLGPCKVALKEIERTGVFECTEKTRDFGNLQRIIHYCESVLATQNTQPI